MNTVIELQNLLSNGRYDGWTDWRPGLLAGQQLNRPACILLCRYTVFNFSLGYAILIFLQSKTILHC